MPASLDFSNDDELEFPLTEEQVACLTDVVLSHEGVERECYVSVSVVTDTEIAAANLEWRGHDSATDGVSLACERPDDPDLPPGEPC